MSALGYYVATVVGISLGGILYLIIKDHCFHEWDLDRVIYPWTNDKRKHVHVLKCYKCGKTREVNA